MKVTDQSWRNHLADVCSTVLLRHWGLPSLWALIYQVSCCSGCRRRHRPYLSPRIHLAVVCRNLCFHCSGSPTSGRRLQILLVPSSSDVCGTGRRRRWWCRRWQAEVRGRSTGRQSAQYWLVIRSAHTNSDTRHCLYLPVTTTNTCLAVIPNITWRDTDMWINTPRTDFTWGKHDVGVSRCCSSIVRNFGFGDPLRAPPPKGRKHIPHNFTPIGATVGYGWLRGTVGRTSVFDRRTVPVLRSTCSWWVTTYVGKPSAVGQPTRPAQPFILSE